MEDRTEHCHCDKTIFLIEPNTIERTKVIYYYNKLYLIKKNQKTTKNLHFSGKKEPFFSMMFKILPVSAYELLVRNNKQRKFLLLNYFPKIKVIVIKFYIN